MKHHVCKYCKCPFYKSDEPQKIYCEGVIPGTSIHLAFESRSEMTLYRREYCERAFAECRVYQMCDDKYDEMGNLKQN